MRFKKTVSAALAAALTVSTASICAFAAEDKDMKEEMTYVKQRLDIPEELSEFNYSTGTQYNKTRYNFSWSVPQDKQDKTPGSLLSFNVNIIGKVITNLYVNRVYSGDSWQASFAKLSDAELIKKAKEYIKAINPTITKNTVINEDSLNINLFGNEATLSFYRVANGVKVTNQTGSIAIDKNTGELIRYSYNWISGAGFSDTSKAISEAEAKKAYQDLFGSDLVYTLEYDWETKKYTPHLIYKQSKYGQINAFTGKISVFEDYEAYGSNEDDVAMESAAVADNGIRAKGEDEAKEITFSQAELEKLEKENSLIKAEDALKMLRKYDFFLIPETSEVTWQNCSYNEVKGYYIRNVSFSADIKDYYDLNSEEYKTLIANGYNDDDKTVSGNFSYNAETGELLSFWNFSYDNGTNLTDQKADSIATKAAKALLGDKYSKFSADPEKDKNTSYKEYDSWSGMGIGDPITTSVSYNANREAYGIKCVNENYRLTVGNNGYVSNFSVNYNPDVTYPKPTNIISADTAYKKFFENVDFGLRYRCAYRSNDKKTVTALVYAADSTLCIDAFTGKRVNSDGSELYVNESGTYTDLEGSKYKEYAEKLASYGIKLMDKEGRLNENDAATAADFAQLIESVGLYGSSVDAEAVKAYNIEENTKLDRKTAAVLLVMAKYGNEVAELTSIFKNKFSDIKDDSKYLGYAMISDASGWITGNAKGEFLPDAVFSRGNAIKLIYDYLSKASV